LNRLIADKLITFLSSNCHTNSISLRKLEGTIGLGRDLHFLVSEELENIEGYAACFTHTSNVLFLNLGPSALPYIMLDQNLMYDLYSLYYL
jgi:hypothetical protein